MPWYRGLALLVLLGALSTTALAQPEPKTLTSENPQTNGRFGEAVGGLSDINGDGVADIIVGAPNESGFTRDVAAGSAYILSGADGSVLLDPASPNETDGGRYGTAVAGIGDTNGDGEDDVLIGASGESGGAGRAYIVYDISVFGSGSSVSRTLASPNEESAGQFGFSVAGVGDVNGDGFGDVVVGAPQENVSVITGDFSNAGRAYLFDGNTGDPLSTFESPSPATFGRFGDAVAGIGDVTGDGVPDVLVGAPGEGASDDGRAYVFSGALRGPTSAVEYTLSSENPVSAGSFGGTVAGLGGSVDDDGVPDVIVGARGETVDGTSQAGRAYIFSGADGARLRTLPSPNREEGGQFGVAIAAVDDGNGDGVPDALIGAGGESSGAGRAYVFSGTNESPYFTLTSPNAETDGGFGTAVAGAPRPDGRADPIIGAPNENPDASPDGAGRAYAFSGSVLPVELTEFTARSAEAGAVTLTWTTASETNNAGFAVERRSVGNPASSSEFTRIGFVSGRGTTTEPQQYRFRDGDLPIDAPRVAYRLKQIDRDGAATYSEVIEIEVGAPTRFALRSNVPNPFRNQTTIHYDLPRPGPVRLAVYDALGRRVAVLVDEAQTAGRKQVDLNGRRLASGVYLLRLEADGRVAHHRITVVR